MILRVLRGASLAILVACASSLAAKNPKDARLKWNKNWGPLVPHKTFPKDCSLCHVAKRWDVLRSDFRFDHQKETGYALEDAHAQAACLRCHNDRGPANVYAARGCGGCHQDPHRSAMGFDCRRCHSQSAWRSQKPVADHARTRFPLTGFHAAVACDRCHLRAAAGDFSGANPECETCHWTDYQKAPNHAAMNFPKTCRDCHTTASFLGARFDHGKLGAGSDCYSCHSADYPRGPDHVAKNYPKTCQDCHHATSWSATRFNHASLGANPDCFACHSDDFLRGPNHAAMNFSRACLACHNAATWSGARFDHANLGSNPDCYSCHSANYQGAPDHAARNYPRTCASCHSTSAWAGVSFNHGALGANSDCYGCHQADFSRGPNHVALNYPKTCADCHNAAAWTTASLNHRFPLTGPHNVSCSICHQGGATSAFTCLVCHQHAQTAMDDKHKNLSGYGYDSVSCVRCHPNGKK